MSEIILDPKAAEQLMLDGDLSKLNPQQRIQFYAATCERVGLDPVARPFDYLRLQGKLTLYANKGGAEQLRNRHKISLYDLNTQVLDGIFIASISAKTPDGRTDSDSGAVPVDGLKGERLANAMLKGVTKAKRRVTLSLVGLGMMDETEVETIPGAKRVEVDEAHDALPVIADEVRRKTEVDPQSDGIAWKNVQMVESVRECSSTRDGKKHVWFAIVFADDEREHTTWSKTIAEDAEKARQYDLPVHSCSKCKAKGDKTYWNIDEFELAKAPQSAGAE